MVKRHRITLPTGHCVSQALPLMALCTLLAGCASGGNGDPERSGEFPSDAERMRSMLLQDENGLEVRQVVVSDDPQTFAHVMAPWMTNDDIGVDAATAERLRRNGFRLIRVPAHEIDSVISELGGASLDVSSWHGQVLQWRDLHSLPLGAAGRTMAVDGRVRRYEGGELRLLARGWVVPMEQGPRMQLELVPQHLRGESQYHRLLGQNRTDAQSLPTLAAHALLEPGYAYILTCECPQAKWTASDESAESDEPDDKPAETQASSRRQPVATVGPDAATPTTLGQLMLTSHAGRPSRGMLVFTPRIAAELFPPGEPLAIDSPDGRLAGERSR